VLWTNEENGAAGAHGYQRLHQGELTRHVVAMESDRGTFKPEGFSFVGSDAARKIVQALAQPLGRLEAAKILDKGSDTDVGVLAHDNVPTLGLLDDETKYFWYHHSDGDTIDKLNPRELSACAAAMAVMAWQVADAPEPLPRAETASKP
jgi:carboxypeptidase Q